MVQSALLLDDTEETEDTVIDEFGAGNIKSERTMGALRSAGGKVAISKSKTPKSDSANANAGAELNYSKILELLNSGKEEDLRLLTTLLTQQKLKSGNLNELLRLLALRGQNGTFEMDWLDLIPDGISSLDGKRQVEWLVRTVHMLMMVQSYMQQNQAAVNMQMADAFKRLALTEQRILAALRGADIPTVQQDLRAVLQETSTRQAITTVANYLRTNPQTMEWLSYQKVGLTVATPWLKGLSNAALEFGAAAQDLARTGKLNPAARVALPEGFQAAQQLNQSILTLAKARDGAAINIALTNLQQVALFTQNALATQQGLPVSPSYRDALLGLQQAINRVLTEPARTVSIDSRNNVIQLDRVTPARAENITAQQTVNALRPDAVRPEVLQQQFRTPEAANAPVRIQDSRIAETTSRIQETFRAPEPRATETPRPVADVGSLPSNAFFSDVRAEVPSPAPQQVPAPALQQSQNSYWGSLSYQQPAPQSQPAAEQPRAIEISFGPATPALNGNPSERQDKYSNPEAPQPTKLEKPEPAYTPPEQKLTQSDPVIVVTKPEAQKPDPAAHRELVINKDGKPHEGEMHVCSGNPCPHCGTVNFGKLTQSVTKAEIANAGPQIIGGTMPAVTSPAKNYAQPQPIKPVINAGPTPGPCGRPNCPCGAACILTAAARVVDMGNDRDLLDSFMKRREAARARAA